MVKKVTKDVKKSHTQQGTALGDKLYLHMQQTPLGVIEWSPEFKIANWNAAAENIFGYSRKEVLGKHPAGLFFPDNLKAEIDKAGGKFLSERSGTSSVIDCKRKDGKMVTTEWHSTPLIDSTGKVVGAASLVQDITVRKQTEERMYQLAAIVESSDAAIVGATLDAKITTWNTGAERIYGYTKSEALGKKLSLISSKEKYSEMLSLLKRIQQGEEHIEPFATQRIRKDKKTIDIFLTVSPTRDINGNIIGISNIARDITKRIQAENEVVEANKQLARSNRELQDFASVASHDLQEPLRKIQAFGDRLQTKYAASLPDEAADYILRMQNAASRMQILINDLLSFARVTTKAQPFEKVDLNEILTDVLSDLEIRIADYKGKIIKKRLPVVEADPMQMRQLFQNLIGNGLKFHKKGVLPVIKISCEYDEDTKQKDDSCRIVIEDNGIGFEEKYLDRIFNVFQRLHTSSEYSGTGVGLAVCRKIVERHNGMITAQSKPGKGSRFIVHLPIIHDDPDTHTKSISNELYKKAFRTL